MSRFIESEFGVKKSSLRPSFLGKMSFSVPMIALAVVSVVVSGCVAPGYSREKEMLFEDKIHVEPRIGTFIPSESDFDAGPVLATRIAFQYDYGAYVSLEFTAAEEIEQSGNAPAVGAVTQIRDLEHLALSEADRRAFVLSFDWDFPFTENERMPYLRWGLGVGVLHVTTGTNPTVRTDLMSLGSAKVYAKDETMILVRPTIGLYWEAIEDMTFFVDAQYDYAEAKGRISLNGDDRNTGVIDFSGINVLFGLSYSF